MNTSKKFLFFDSRQKSLISEKRGRIVAGNVIFIILNLIVFAVLLIFVIQAGSGKAVYEEMYAKEIVLFLDNAKPNMEFKIDMSKAIEIAEKNEFSKDNIIKIEGNEVTIKLGSVGDYSYKFFSDLNVEIGFDEVNENFLIIKTT